MTRTHDALYLDEDRYECPTELTRWFVNILRREAGLLGADSASMLDVGCATGEVTFQIKTALPTWDVVGADVVSALLERARSRVANCRFIESSVEFDSFIVDVGVGYQLVAMKGVHSIFDDPLNLFDRLIRTTGAPSDPSTLVVAGLFNDAPVDVFVRYRTQDQNPQHREPGWNIVSRATVEEWLEARSDVKSHEWVEYSSPIVIPPQSDPLRSFTIDLADGNHALTNGLNLLLPMRALVVRL